MTLGTLWLSRALRTGSTCLTRGSTRPVRATYTEDVQQDGSVLSLRIGEQVCGELVNGWKTRGHGRVSADWELRLRGSGAGLSRMEVEVAQGRGGGLRALALVPLAPGPPQVHSGARCAPTSLCPPLAPSMSLRVATATLITRVVGSL